MSYAHGKVNYFEFPAHDLGRTKVFFESAFGWKFTDYGPDYTAIDPDCGLDGGIYRAEKASTTESGAALIIFYSEDLEATQAKIEACGGVVHQEIFSFPGGRRFQFKEPSGSEFAVWSDKGLS
ncbi:VOC family protein [Rhodopirellula halodulae]|uniref:VOC family protein n=1 Tax=Rhodopirellula halodulae TaxID=2894198 RepID=UPI001E2F747B|nr:VOC family protein [Rhodopirellula sp. JC737]MCC9658628.1 VOC family protein [Rhodopirellula sp. JC737]